MAKLNIGLYRLTDTKQAKELINQKGEEKHLETYEGLTFGNIIGSVFLNRIFNSKMPIYERVKIGRKRSEVTGKMRNVYEYRKVGEITGWEAIKKQLHGRPLACTQDFIDKCKELLDAGAQRLFIYTKSMSLGLFSWDFNNPEKKSRYEKLFGVDEWRVSASQPKIDYETVNLTLKKLGVAYRVKTSGMLIQRVMRSDLW